MRHRNHRHGLTLFLVLLVVFGAAWPARSDPDFSKVNDILGGRRFLMRVDDLVVTNLAIRDDNIEPNVAFVHTLRSKIHEVIGAGAFTAIGNTNPAFGSAVSRADEVAPQALGRLFNLPRDVVVSVLLDIEGRWHVFADDPGGDLKAAVVPTAVRAAANGESAQAVVMADVDGDGFADAVIAYYGSDDQGQTVEALRVVTAVDPKDPSKGLRFGPELIVTSAQGLFVAPLSALRTGDIDGDGFPEVLGFNGTTLSVATVNRTTLALSVANQVPLPNGESVFPFNMEAGRFRASPGCATCEDVVVVGRRHADSMERLTRYSFGVDQNVTPPALDLKLFARVPSGKSDPIVHVFLAKGPLRNWAVGRDLLVIGTAVSKRAFVEILEADENLDFKLLSVTTASKNVPGGHGCLYGLAVGNFDDRSASGDHVFTLHVATLWRQLQASSLDPKCSDPVLTGSGDGGVLRPLGIRLWSVTPSTKNAPGSNHPDWLSILSEKEVLTPLHEPSRFASLRIGDVQGRSLVLGAPEKVTIVGHLQPDVVLGIPPMHIDWVNPGRNLDPRDFPGCDRPPAPCLLNISVLPTVPKPGVGFGTGYSWSESSEKSSERKSTTSWSVGAKVVEDLKQSFGAPKTEEVSREVKISAGYKHDQSVATQYNKYDKQTDKLELTTGFADYLIYTLRRQNIYYYPVIGRETCDDPIFHCLDPNAKKKPLYVSFSGPDVVHHYMEDATNKEWYQPVHEPGNVFSYPATLDQLQQSFSAGVGGAPLDLARLKPLTDFQWEAVDTSDSTYKVTWSNSSGQTKTVEATDAENYSFMTTASTTITYEGGKVEGSLEFDFDQSFSVATHNALTQTISASTGVQVNKPPFPGVVEQNYLYSFGGYVFGTNNIEPTPQVITPIGDDGKPAGVATTGPMVVAFLADPIDGASPWWVQAYALPKGRPDVGLNHPERWNWTTDTKKAAFNFAEPHVPPQDQAFYRMKGLFITLDSANGIGSTRTMATAGDQMRLTARVYNFSMVDTDDPALPQPAARVRVRFYGQKYDTTSDGLDGPAFLIGETAIASIPAFNNAPEDPRVNWALTSVPFDTTPYANTSLVFWVVVWMEDADGRLVAEMPEHGLAAIPAPDITQITDVRTETYSNNVGMYGVYMPFQVVPKTGLAAATPTPGRLAVDEVTVPPPPVVVDTKARITATIRALDGSRDGVPVAFYDGDPAKGGRLFHAQVIPRLSPEKPYVMRSFFRPQLCGTHTIVVVAGHETTGTAVADGTVTITADPTTGGGCPRAITGLGPAKVWVGLRNGDDVGTSFDLRADAYLGSTLVGSGQVNGVSGGGSGFNNARLTSIPLTFFQPVEAPGANLRVELSARIACSGRTHRSGAARLWLNDAQAGSRVGVTVDGATKDYYLRSGSVLGPTPGTGPKSVVDVHLDSRTVCDDRPFAPFGTWRITLP